MLSQNYGKEHHSLPLFQVLDLHASIFAGIFNHTLLNASSKIMLLYIIVLLHSCTTCRAVDSVAH